MEEKNFFESLFRFAYKRGILTARASDILIMRTVREKTFKEIGKEFGLSSERVRQIFKVNWKIVIGSFEGFLWKVRRELEELDLKNKELTEEILSLRNMVIHQLLTEIYALERENEILRSRCGVLGPRIINRGIHAIAKGLDEEIFGKKIEDLKLHKTLKKVLRENNIFTIGDLIDRGPKELKKISGIGPSFLESLKEVLKEEGLIFE